MSKDFILDVTKLNDVHSNLSKTSKTLENYNKEIYLNINNLSNYWKGPSYNAFLEDATSFKQPLNELVDLFSKYAKIVDTLDIEGINLLSKISQFLDCENFTVTLRDNVYKAEDIGSYKGSNLSYDVDIESVTSAKDAYNHAIDVQNSLSYDMEVISVEIRNEQSNMKALEDNKTKMDSDVYEKLHSGLKTKITYLETQYDHYVEAYKKVSSLTVNSNDVVDFLTGKERDGQIREASDGLFGIGDNDEMAKAGLQVVNMAIRGLVPVSVLVESIDVNESHQNLNSKDVNVSRYAMEAAFNIAENTENGTSEIAPGVVAFNSKEFVDKGASLIEGSTSANYTFLQSNAYGDSEDVATSEEGFDSIRIQKPDGEYEYMTYAQYANLLSNTEVDAVTQADPPARLNDKNGFKAQTSSEDYKG